MPTVSILIPAYNVAPYIAETLDSLDAQSYRDFEAIVVNDGSTDETEQALAPYRDRIVYISQRNGGLSAARNTAWRVARGRYVALLDGDDIWLPHYLSTMMPLIEADPNLDLVYPNAIFFGSPNFSGRKFQDVFPACPNVTFERLLKRECVVFGSPVFKRELAERVGMFDESLKGLGAEDFDLWLRMLRAGCRFAFTTEPLVKYRWRRESLSNDGIGLLSCAVSVYEKVLGYDEVTPSLRAWIEKSLVEFRAQLNHAVFKEKLAAGDYRAAAHHLALANKFMRSPKLSLVQMGLRIAPSLMARLAQR